MLQVQPMLLLAGVVRQLQFFCVVVLLLTASTIGEQTASISRADLGPQHTKSILADASFASRRLLDSNIDDLIAWAGLDERAEDKQARQARQDELDKFKKKKGLSKKKGKKEKETEKEELSEEELKKQKKDEKKRALEQAKKEEKRALKEQKKEIERKAISAWRTPQKTTVEDRIKAVRKIPLAESIDHVTLSRDSRGCLKIAEKPIVKAPGRSACHKAKRRYVDSPRNAAVVLAHQPNDSPRTHEALYSSLANLLPSVKPLVEEVVVLLTGAPDPTLHREITDTLLAGENHFLVYTPQELTPFQALARAVSATKGRRILVLEAQSSSEVQELPACLDAMLLALKENSMLGLVGPPPPAPVRSPAGPGAAAGWGFPQASRKQGREDGSKAEHQMVLDTAQRLLDVQQVSRKKSGVRADVHVEVAVTAAPFAVQRSALLHLGMHRSEAACRGSGALALKPTTADARHHTQGPLLTARVLRELSVRMWLSSMAVGSIITSQCRPPPEAAPPTQPLPSLDSDIRNTPTGLIYKAQAKEAMLKKRLVLLTMNRRLPAADPSHEEVLQDGAGSSKGGMSLEGIGGWGMSWAGSTGVESKCQAVGALASDMCEVRKGPEGREDEGSARKTVSYAVNYNAQAGVVPELVGRLAALDVEVLVNDDSITDQALWMDVLRGAGVRYMLMYSHDIHIIRGLTRLVDLADSDLVVLAQDTELPPKDTGWLQTAVHLFQHHRSLGLLGGRQGFMPAKGYSHFFKKPARTWGHGWWEQRRGKQAVEPIQYVDPASHAPFQFVWGVAMGPVVARRTAFLQVGGFHGNLSCAGEPGAHYDTELSLRMWAAGWRVGLFESFFQWRPEPALAARDAEMHEANERQNTAMSLQMYKNMLPQTNTLVRDANKELQEKISTTRW